MNSNKNEKSKLILLVGFPRSGTTWFSNLLNAHSEVCYRHELIGRNYSLFGERLFRDMKQNNGLSDADYDKAMEVIYSANIDSDKPPFFKKKYGLHRFPKIHYFCWLGAKVIPFLRPVYNWLFKLKTKSDWRVLLKETRSLKNMSSMATGLRIDDLLFLVRRPHGSILSHVNGVKKGTMQPVGQALKEEIYAELPGSEYLQELYATKNEASELTDIECYAANWTLYHEEVLKLKQQFPQSTVCFYDEFVDDAHGKTQALMKRMNLAYDQAIDSFISASSGQEQSLLKDAGDEYYSVYRKQSFDKDAWKKKLAAEDIEVIDRYSMPLFEQLKTIFGKDL